MILDSKNPRTIRDRFIARKFRVKVAIGIIFLGAIALMSWFLAAFMPNGALLRMLIGDAIALGVAYYFYIIWDKRPVQLACPNCEKIISSNTPWVCSVCKRVNTNTTEFPFVHKCGNPECGVEPKSYRCHHQDADGKACREIIFLSDDEDRTNYAYAVNSPTEVKPPDERTVKRQAHDDTKEDKTHEIELTELDLKLKKIKDQRDGPKIKSQAERKKDMVDDDYAAMMGVREHLRKKTEEVKILYKDDPEALKDALDAIEEIRKRYS